MPSQKGTQVTRMPPDPRDKSRNPRHLARRHGMDGYELDQFRFQEIYVWPHSWPQLDNYAPCSLTATNIATNSSQDTPKRSTS